MPKAERTLKIYSLYRQDRKEAVPEVRLSGVWLNKIGFRIGDKVNITTREKLIVIQTIKSD